VSGYGEVVQILRDEYFWPVGVSPAPGAVATALATQTPEQVASVLERFCRGWAENNEPPYGYPVSGPQGAYEWYRYRCFSDGKEYAELDSSIALGLQHELPEDRIREAKSVSEWIENMEMGRDRLGYKAIDITSEWWAMRKAKAAQVPLEWSMAGAGLIYQLAVLSGTIQVGLTGFAVAYASTSPRLAEVRGLDAQMWLDNCRADDVHKPRPWLVGGLANPISVR